MVGGFSGFEDRNDVGRFPNRRDVSGPNRQIKEVSRKTDAQRPKMLHVEHCEAVWASSWRTFATFDGVHGVGLGERSERAVQWITGFEVFIDTPRVFVLFEILNISVLLTEMVGYR